MMKRLLEALQNQTDNYILPFFWQHGESEAKLREYVRAIHEANIGAFCVESRPHEDFVGPKWWQDMDVILDEAEKRGMKVWILDDKHFPTGYAAGAVENAPASLCHQYLCHNEVYAAGPMPQAEIDIEQLSHPKKMPPWMMPPGPPPKRIFNDDHLFAVVANPVEEGGKLGTGIDLTSRVQDGKLLWDVPAGYYQISVLYLTRDAMGRNDYINMLDESSCKLLLDTVYEPHFAHYADRFGTTIAGFFSDEPPIGNSPGYTGAERIGEPQMALSWSRHMAGAMTDEYKGDFTAALPLLWAQGTDEQHTAQMRNVYMQAVTKLVARCFSQQLGQWCETHGVEYIGHMLEDCDLNANLGPSMGHFFRGLSGQHMAGIDNIGGQVLIGGQHVHRRPGMPGGVDDAGFYHYTLAKLGNSMAVVDSNKKGRCMLENFGAYGWQLGVSGMKYLMDHFLVRGINRYVPHAFSPKAFPDPDCPPHFYAHGENPQYRPFGELMAYVNRVCHLIDGGKPELKVALLYHGESRWGGYYQSNIEACRALTTHQFGFAMIPADVFTEPKRYSQQLTDGKLVINGISYDALLISDAAYLPRSVVEFAIRAKTQAFPVLMTGSSLQGVLDANGSESKALLDELGGLISCPLEQLGERLAQYAQRDAVLSPANKDVTVYHYRNDADYYLFLNENHTSEYRGTAVLPQTGEAALYRPWENRLEAVQTDGSALRLSLAPLEMVIVVMGDVSAALVSKLHFTENDPCMELTEFSLFACEAGQYPDFTPRDNTAMLRGKRWDAFSGHLRYETKFVWDGVSPLRLEIETLHDTAEVLVNGQSAGMVLAPPYYFELPKHLLTKHNTLVIEVTTTLERRVRAMGENVTSMNLPGPVAPIGILSPVMLRQGKA